MITSRELNRATLSRQLLLERAALSPLEAVEHLVGMQAQAPFPPYTGLWTRLEGFEADALGGLLLDRSVVRLALMRGTVHLVSAADCLVLRPLLQPQLDRGLRGSWGRPLAGLDAAEVGAVARELVEESPRSTAELGRLLVERWPDRDSQALVNAARATLPLVQLPPRAVWGRSGQTVVTTAEKWLGRPLGDPAAGSEAGPVGSAGSGLEGMVLRYLGAFGPASVADVQKWSGLTRLREVVDRLRPRLVVDQDESGTELYDLPDAPRPDPDTPAPVRFLPEYDNLLLSHADPSRVIAPEHRSGLMSRNGIIPGTVLVDGTVAALYAHRKGTLEIVPLRRITRKERSEVEREGGRLLSFLTNGSPGTVCWREEPGPPSIR
jgi:hypothetical protein